MNLILRISKEFKGKEIKQGDKTEGEGGVTRSIIDEIDSSDIKGDQMEGESIVLLEVSLMNFILRISNEIK